MKTRVLFLFLFHFQLSNYAQNLQSNWNDGLIVKSDFIEDNGNYADKNTPSYLVDNRKGAIYLINAKSVSIKTKKINSKNLETYNFLKQEEKEAKIKLEKGDISYDIFENIEKEKKKYLENIKKDQEEICMNWLNCNPSVISPIEKNPNYYVYSQNSESNLKCNSYNKLQIKSLYNKVDILYSSPTLGGVKYELTLHSGANINDIQLEWNAVEHLSIDKKGNLKVKSKYNQFIDYAPKAYYKDSRKPIKIKYKLTGNKLSFDIEKYDTKKTIVIDPWIVVLPSVADDINVGVHVKTDNIGNSYVMNMYYDLGDISASTFIHKFDPLGNLLWTYSPDIYFGWYGDLFILQSTGDVFFSTGTSGGIYERLDTDANFLSTGTGGEYETWKLLYNCEKTVFNLFGKDLDLEENYTLDFNEVHTVNETTGEEIDNTILNFIFNPLVPSEYSQEVRSACSNLYGGYFLNTLTSIVFICEDYQTVWQTNLEQNFNYDGPTYVYPYTEGNGTLNNLASGRNFLYLNSGNQLTKFNLSCGTIEGTVTIPNDVFEGSDGILVDDCDNIFIGTESGVNKYDQNLILLESIPTEGPVFDIDFGINNTIIATGYGYVASYDITHCGRINDCFNIEIDGPITPQEVTICAGDSVQLFVNVMNSNSCSGNNEGITWSPSIGLNNSNAYSPWVSPDVTTTYTINTSHMGCDTLNPIYDTITVNVIGPNINLGNDTTFCNGSILLDAENVGANYLWQDGSTDQTYNVIDEGIYWVDLEIDGCIERDSINLIDGSFEVNLGEDISVCDPVLILNAGNNGATYIWQDNTTNQTFNATDFGAFYVDVTFGICTQSDSIQISLGTIPTFLPEDTLLCDNSSIILDAQNENANFNWSTGENSQSIIVNQQGEYWVDIVESECMVSDTITVVFYEPEVLFAASDSAGCKPLLIDFTDLSNTSLYSIVSWNWEFGDGTTSSLSNPSYQYNTTGSYDVSLSIEDENNCSNSIVISDFIQIYPEPQAEFNYLPEYPNIEHPEISFFDTSIDAISWFWNFGDGSSTDQQNPTHNYSEGGEYNISLEVTNSFGCVNLITWLLIIETNYAVFIPNSFTPNNDGINDYFFPTFTGIDLTNYSLEIYNRWGEKVYQTNNYKDKWDGGYYGDNNSGNKDNSYFVSNNIYTWIIKVKRSDIAEKETIVGHIKRVY